MDMVLRHSLLAFTLSLASASACAGDNSEATGMLARMAQAMSELDYQGTFVYVRGETVETMHITHVRDENGIRERMYTSSGPKREVIRDSSGVRCALGQAGGPIDEALASRSIFPEIPLDKLAEAAHQYMFKLGGSTRIAGHRGQRLSVVPRDEFRYGYDLWVEADSGLLLRWVLYDADRRALAKLMFTELTIGEGVDWSELESDTPAEAFVRLEPTSKTRHPTVGPKRPDSPRGMPPGFKLTARTAEPEDASGLQHLVYSDGLASVSIYIEHLGGDNQGIKEGLSRLGTTNAYSRLSGKRQVTAIGEVPAITVKKMTNAFVAPQ